jgi:hypothetical protein
MPGVSHRISPLGLWYSLVNSDKKIFIFAFMNDGILVPCGAQISGEGRVEEIIPLSVHAKQILNRIPEGVIQAYIRRIENTVADNGSGS